MRLRSLIALFALAGCGEPIHGSIDGGNPDLTQAANVYPPFSAANYVAQQARVALFEEMAAIRGAATFAQASCGDLNAPSAGTLAEVYTRNDTNGGVLRDKVKGRIDDHSYNMAAAIGTTMDQMIAKALADCHAGTLAPKPAAQLVDKSLQWFFYASVFHELTLGKKLDSMSPAKWDEAFGYYGRSADGMTSRGIAGTARKRDDNFKLTLNDTVFQQLIAGRNALEAKNGAGVNAAADKIDQTLLVMFAYSTAREFVLLPGSANGAELLAEGIAFFNIIEPFMKMQSAGDAQFVRDELGKANFAMPAAIDTAGIVSRIEKVFGIDVTP